VSTLPRVTPLAGATATADSVRSAVAAGQSVVNSAPVTVTLSLGVAEHALRRTLDATLAIADEALDHAKAAGRNLVIAG